MTDYGESGQSARGEMLVTLRYGLRQSVRLAEQLATDPIVGCEARGMMCRLQAIRDELDGIMSESGDNRRADNDPLWSDLLDRRPANHAGPA